jgi:hypothetical protein
MMQIVCTITICIISKEKLMNSGLMSMQLALTLVSMMLLYYFKQQILKISGLKFGLIRLLKLVRYRNIAAIFSTVEIQQCHFGAQ